MYRLFCDTFDAMQQNVNIKWVIGNAINWIILIIAAISTAN